MLRGENRGMQTTPLITMRVCGVYSNTGNTGVRCGFDSDSLLARMAKTKLTTGSGTRDVIKYRTRVRIAIRVVHDASERVVGIMR